MSLVGAGLPDHAGYRTNVETQIAEFERRRLADGPYRVPECTGALAVSGFMAQETAEPVIPMPRQEDDTVAFIRARLAAEL